MKKLVPLADAGALKPKDWIGMECEGDVEQNINAAAEEEEQEIIAQKRSGVPVAFQQPEQPGSVSPSQTKRTMAPNSL
jgi:hypothetical protein